MTAVSSPLDVYTRRVSFSNLDTDDQAGSGLVTYPHSDSSSHCHKELDLSKLFGNYTISPSTTTYRKKLRLPKPPLKLILKNKLTSVKYRCNNANTAGALDLSPTEVLSSGAENNEYSSDELLSLESEDEACPPTTRGKLFTQMTDEELMALDPQFSRTNTSKMEQFKFGSVATYHLPVRRCCAVNTNAQAVLAAAKPVVYPSLNENNYKSILLTLKHQDYDHEDTYNRTLLVLISGRKHTWNSLDWLLLTGGQKSPGFLQNGDFLVVAALVPYKYLDAEARSHQRKKAMDENLHQKCDLILRYVVANLPDPLIKLKITVELVMDMPPASPNEKNTKIAKNGMKMMIFHLFKQYNPSLVLLGNRLTNLNFKYPIRIRASAKNSDKDNSEFLIKLLSYLVKYSTVPVVLVGNSTIFHQKVERKPLQSVKFLGSPKPQRSILDIPPNNFRKGSATSDNLIESFNGGTSSNEQRSVNSSGDLQAEIEELMTSGIEMRFAAMLLSILQSSSTDLQQYLSLINDDSADRLSREVTASRVHQAYVSSAQGRRQLFLSRTSSSTSTRAYRVKSLILYSEEDEKKNERIINEKKLKKTASHTSAAPKGEEKKGYRLFLQRLGFKKSKG